MTNQPYPQSHKPRLYYEASSERRDTSFFSFLLFSFHAALIESTILLFGMLATLGEGLRADVMSREQKKGVPQSHSYYE